MAAIDYIRGRQVVQFLFNKSGGSVAAGDVVIIDTSNDTAFTTTTSGQSLSALGVVQESIANNAQGRVCVSGYVPLVNVNASVTRGHFLETHTVAKQGTGNSARRTGSFGRFLTGGATPSAWLYGNTDVTASGNAMASDTLWDAAGDLAVGTGADTAAKLTKGATGTFLGVPSGSVAYAFPPGYEWDHATLTSGSVTVTGTAEASETTILTGNSFTADGTALWVEFFTPRVDWTAGAASRFMFILLYEASTLIGRIALIAGTNAVNLTVPVFARIKLTPSSGSRQYIVKAYKSNAGDSGVIYGGGGGSAAQVAASLRVTKA